jgi:transposase
MNIFLKFDVESNFRNMKAKQVKFPQIVNVGCGLDVHQSVIVATVRKSDNDYETRSFEAYTSSLKELREWCQKHGVTQIAMESTGIYWKPVYNILEEYFEVILVNARHVKNIPGHKTDKKDSAWLSKLLLGGLLKGSFIPPKEIRDLRDIVRYKKKQVQQVSSERNRIYKILEDANIKLSTVMKADSVSGQKVIDALINGETKVENLLRFIHGKTKASRQEILKALEGNLTDHHRFMLKIIRQSIRDKELLIADLDKQIDQMADKYSVEIELLSTIDGVGRESAIAIISETGTDMSRFPNEHHLSSLGGMSPGNNESAGKKKVQKPSKGTNISGQH